MRTGLIFFFFPFSGGHPCDSDCGLTLTTCLTHLF